MLFLRKLFASCLGRIAAFSLIMWLGAITVKAQCSRVSTCGYTVYQQYAILNIVPSLTACPFGYNYNVAFSYSLSVIGTNACYDGTIGVQPEFFCNSGQSNGYYTIVLNAPLVGAGTSTTTTSGTLVSTTNPFNFNTDCASVTPTSLGCNGFSVTTFGPGMSSSTNGCSIQILPVRLIDITSNMTPAGLVISWRTASEHNSAYFEINRFEEQLNQWQPLGRIEAAGESSRILRYDFTDSHPRAGINYYQLKQVDHDGTVAFSPMIASAPVTTSELAGTRAFNHTLPIIFRGTYTLLDVTGTQRMSGYSDYTVVTTENILPGLYFLAVKGENGAVYYRLYKGE